MKNIFKKSLVWIMILLLSVGTIGTFLPGASAKAEAGSTKYMVKMVPRADGNNDNRLGQYIQVEKGKTYTLSFQLYVIEPGIVQGWKGENGSGTKLVQDYMTKEGTVKQVKRENSYTATENEKIYVNIQCGSGAFYIWDIKFTAENSDINLLQNADFTDGDGSFVNWSYSGWGGDHLQTITTNNESEEFEHATGRKVLLYNEELFSTNISNRDELELNGEPMYMAHIGQYWKRISQTLTVESGKTYTLEYEYCKTIAGNLQGRVGYVTTDDAEGTFTAHNDTTSTGECKKATVSFTMPSDKTELFVRFEGTDATNKVDGYIWNVKLTKEGESKNLLKNADFTQNGGSWIGWDVSGYGVIKDIETSNKAGLNTNCEILSYDRSLFHENADLAEWKVQPILQETLDFTYKTTLKNVTEETPTMTFVVKNGDDVIQEKTVEGQRIVSEKNGYAFSLNVLPQNMSCTIQSTLNVGGNKQTKIYSVKKYCATLLANNGTDDCLKDLLSDLVRYGAATQTYISKTDTITTGLTSFIEGHGSKAVLINASHLTNFISGDNTGTYKWTNASLRLDGKVTIRFKFTAENISGLVVKVNAAEYEIHNAGTYYYVDVPMAATQYGDEVNAQFFVNDEKQGASLSYSVNTYLYRMRNVEKVDALVVAIYHYGKSASNYRTYILTGKVETTESTTALDNEYEDQWDL